MIIIESGYGLMTFFNKVKEEELEEYKEHVFVDGILICQGSYSIKCCILDDKILIKPLYAYHEFVFEKIFGFKPHCSDFDKNKIIWFKKTNFHIRNV